MTRQGSRSFYSFVVRSTSRTRRWRVRRRYLQLSVLLIIAVSGAACYGLYALGVHLNQARQTALENRRLKLENENHKHRISTLAERIEQVEETSRTIVKLSGVEEAQELIETASPVQPPTHTTPSTTYATGLNGAGGPFLPREYEASLAAMDTRAQLLVTTLRHVEGMVYQRSCLPSLRPVTAGYASDFFGARPNPFGKLDENQEPVIEFHAGHDFAVDEGTPVYATGSGVVEFADEQGGYGNLIRLNHGNGFETRYGHLSGFNVQPGQAVMRGDVIGFVGSTGRSTGAHLHYEIRIDDRPVDPRRYLPRRKQ